MRLRNLLPGHDNYNIYYLRLSPVAQTSGNYSSQQSAWEHTINVMYLHDTVIIIKQNSNSLIPNFSRSNPDLYVLHKSGGIDSKSGNKANKLRCQQQYNVRVHVHGCYWYSLSQQPPIKIQFRDTYNII